MVFPGLCPQLDLANCRNCISYGLKLSFADKPCAVFCRVPSMLVSAVWLISPVCCCPHCLCVQAVGAGDGSCCFCFEPLPVGAVVKLACPGGHFVHLDCAKRRLQVCRGCRRSAVVWQGFHVPYRNLQVLGSHCGVHSLCSPVQVGCPGPALTFDYLFCPLCGSGKEGRCGNIQVMTAQPHLMHSQLQAELARPLQLRCGILFCEKCWLLHQQL